MFLRSQEIWIPVFRQAVDLSLFTCCAETYCAKKVPELLAGACHLQECDVLKREGNGRGAFMGVSTLTEDEQALSAPQTPVRLIGWSQLETQLVVKQSLMPTQP